MNCKCDCSGTGNIESSNFWTEDWMEKHFKSEFPRLTLLKISQYQQHFSITLDARKNEEMKTKFEKSETDKMNIIQTALANAGIKFFPKYIITRKVSVRKHKKETIHYFYLLSDQFKKILKKKTCPTTTTEASKLKEFEISSGYSRLYFKAIEPRVLEGFSCVKCPHSCNYFRCCF